jgi:hypothetical protein
VLVGRLDSGDATKGVDVGPEPAAGVALAGDSLVVLTPARARGSGRTASNSAEGRPGAVVGRRDGPDATPDAP